MTENEEARDPVEQLAEDYTRRLRSGEHPSIDEYVRKCPEHADEIRELFPMVASMERLGSQESAQRQTAQSRLVTPLAAERIGDFRILREIGRGGMGVVYEAEQESLQRHVALKVRATAATASAKQVERFTREARAAASLHHTNIVPVFGFGQEDGRHYYVMQLIEGVGLDEVLRTMARKPGDAADDGSRDSLTRLMTRALREGRFARKEETETPARDPEDPLPPGHRYWISTARVGLQLADALQYAHRQGVLHRDIKPSNLLLDPQGVIWITDFGLAKHDEGAALTEASDVVGTIRYMAPEQFNGQADGRSDVYSLGLTLYEMLTLTPAFEQTSYGELMQRKAAGALRPPRAVNPAIPRDLETIVLTACAADPAHRYRTAGALAADLQCFLEDRPIQTRRTTPVERVWRWSRRNPALAALSAAAVCLLIAVAIVSAVGRRHADRLLERVEAERTRAQGNLDLAVHAFDDIIDRVASRGLPQSFELDLGVDPAALDETAVTPADAELLQSLLSFFGDFAQRNGVDLRAETANAYRRIGDIRLRLGNLAEADAAYQNALGIYDALQAQAPQDPALVLARTQVANAIGVVNSRSGDWRGAMDSHVRAQQTLAQIPPDRATAAAKFEQAHTLNLLTGTAGRWEIAGLFATLRPMADEAPLPADRLPRRRARLRGRSLLNESRLLTSVNPSNPRIAQADARCRQAEQLLLDLLRQEPNNVAYRVELAQCYRNAVRVHSIEGKYEQAETALAKAIDVLNQLVRDYPDKTQFQYHLADVLCLTVPQSDVPSAEECQRLAEATLMCRRLTTLFPNVPQYQALRAGAWVKLADVQWDANDLDAAEENYTQAADTLKTLTQQSPSVFLYRVLCVRSLVGLSDLKRERGRLAAAQEALDEAVTLAEADTKSRQNLPVYRRLLRLVYLRQARVLAELGRPYLANQALTKAKAALSDVPAAEAETPAPTPTP